jgi:hypothetical protein
VDLPHGEAASPGGQAAPEARSSLVATRPDRSPLEAGRAPASSASAGAGAAAKAGAERVFTRTELKNRLGLPGGRSFTVYMNQAPKDGLEVKFSELTTNCPELNLRQYRFPLVLQISQEGAITAAAPKIEMDGVKSFEIPKTVYACRFEPYLVGNRPVSFFTSYDPR